MSDPKPSPTTPPTSADQPPADGQSHSTHSGQETADFSPIVPSAGSQSPSGGSDSAWSVAERYQIRRPLGTGGFGTVSLAFDQLIQREVALKQPGPKLTESERGSFLREAQLAAKVRHPGIVTVHDVGVDPSGVPFIVYEYLPGANLKSRLQGKPWPVEEAIEMAIALAVALAAAHREGLTHRDLKPANILLDAQGRPLIADFGLAIEETGQEHLRGQIAGTYKYMSPEQVRGDSHLLDGRTDLWSLGVILYELLTGKHPFPAQGADEVKQQILTRDPRPPRQWNEAVPKTVEAIVLRLLSREAKDRPASAAEVAEELRRAITSPAAAPPTDHSLKRETTTTHGRWLALTSLTAVGVALTALLVVIWLLVIEPRRRDGSGSGQTPIIVEETWPFTDADFRSDHWLPLLNPKRGPGEIYFSPEARRSWGPQGNLIVDSANPAFLELGRTSAANYSLELRFAPSKWLGNGGLFVGYGPVVGKPDLAAATLISVGEQEPGQIAVTVSRIELKRGGEQFPTSIVHAPRSRHTIIKSNGDTVTIMAEISAGQITQLYLNHAVIDAPASLPAAKFPCQGKFGLFTLGGTCNFEHCRIRITPEEK